jgi:O-antigen ligase
VVIVVVAIATAIIVFVSLYGLEGTLDLLQIQVSDNGREPRYKKAIELFKENPIFGYGFQYTEDGTIASPIRIYNFHSTLFHVMATMGTFGLLAYLFYFVQRFAILMKSCSPFTTTMLIGFILVESYAMVDTGEFNAIPLMSAVTVMLAVVEWSTKKGNATSALPLATNKHNGYYF